MHLYSYACTAKNTVITIDMAAVRTAWQLF